MSAKMARSLTSSVILIREIGGALVRKPNYRFERSERDRTKQAKKEEKAGRQQGNHPELGSKHQCQNCGAKFFDLNKDPIVCPKCGTVFQGAARVRAAAKPEEEVATPASVDVV